MSDPWYADKIPLGTGLTHRHGKLEVDFKHPANTGVVGPPGPTGPAGADGPPGADGADGTTLPAYTVPDDAGKSLVILPDGSLGWQLIVGFPGSDYDTGDDYDTTTTYEGFTP